jgi:hypothetical protein
MRCVQSRRRYLAAVAGLVGTVGCLGGGREDAEGTNPTSVDIGETTTGSEWRATDDLARLAVRKGIQRNSWPGSTSTIVREDWQFVVAEVVGDELPDRTAVSVVAAGEAYPHGFGGLEDVAGPTFPDTVDGRETPVLGNQSKRGVDGRATVVVPVPCPLDVERVAFRLGGDGGRRVTLPNGAVASLAEPSPSFSLESFDVPGTVTAGEPFSLDVTVTNTSGVDGRFLGAVTVPTPKVTDDDETVVFTGRVATGETKTVSHELSLHDPRTAPVSLTGYVSGTREVTVQNPSTSRRATTDRMAR